MVASAEGLVALGDDEVPVRLGPDDAARLADGGEAAPTQPDGGPAGPVAEGMLPPCPVALLVTDGAVLAWSGSGEGPVSLGSAQLRRLADPLDGSCSVQEVTELVSLGLLAPGGAPEVAPHGYLRQSAPPVDRAGGVGTSGDIPVHSVCASHIAGVPLALGMLVAALRHHDGGKLCDVFDFRPLRREVSTTLQEVAERPVASVFLFSNYMWSVADNLELSAQVALLAPGSVVIHGGPSTPRYRDDAARFLHDHPEVDVMVLGEGEATVVELLDRLAVSWDVDGLVGVPGTIVRSSDGTIHRAEPRERLADLSVLPSPYLDGLFDHLDGGVLDLMPVETNRGCPYGCTFCDWGSATNSRIRTFPLERVFAELEWIAERGVSTLFIADANFGVLPRDLEVARHVAMLKRRHGAPRAVLVSYAKNQTLRAAEIVREWIDAGIATEGSVAFQTTDEHTLDVINRRNIRVERYDELTEEFRRLGLPLAVDLMMGLPGATVDAFAADLQKCIDGELTARIYPTIVLPNSPMNDPEYRSQHQLVVDESGTVVGSSSYDSADYDTMLRLRRIYRAGDHFGVLRHLLRWAQMDHGVPAVEVYRRIDDLVHQTPGSWPAMQWIARHFARYTVPPPSWAEFLHEARRLLVEGFGLPDGTALRTAMAVQEAHLPSRDARFPRVVPLEHDYCAWFAESTGPRVGPVRRLEDYGPASLRVDDPRGVCSGAVAAHLRAHHHPDVDNVMLNEFWIADDWELESPLSRRLPQVIAEERVS